MQHTLFAASSLLALIVTPAIAEPPVAIDGLFDDWSGILPAAVDPTGDATGAFDLGSVYALGHGAHLYLRFEIGALINLPAGLVTDGTLQIDIHLPNSDTLSINLRHRRAFLSSAPQVTITWSAFAFRSAPTFASREYEMRVDLTAYGVSEGSICSVTFSGSDNLAQPALVTFGPSFDPPVRRSPLRPANAPVRIASLNTLFDGIGPGSAREAPLTRLIAAVNADVVCLQEQYVENAAYIGAVLASTATPPDEQPWHVLQYFDEVIASRWPLLAVPAVDGVCAAAVVLLPSGPVCVFTAHLACCGYIGSASDFSRIAAAQDIAETIAALRAGALGPDLAPYANVPIVTNGDWNIVGSRTPLDVIEALPAPALRTVLLRHLASGDTFTWRNDLESFWPGRLDMMAYSPQDFLLRHQFVLDTAELTPEELAPLALLTTDSAASDHLLFVADFASRCPADITEDAVVNSEDFFVFLVAFFTGRADFNADGFTTSQDFFDFLTAFFGGC